MIASRVKQLRTGRFTAAQLAERMSEIGFKWDRFTVQNLENGRRATVTVEELLGLADVFGVAPVHLLVPLDDDEPYDLTPVTTYPSGRARAFVRGTDSLDADPQTYYAEVPRSELTAALMAQLRGRPDLQEMVAGMSDRAQTEELAALFSALRAANPPKGGRGDGER